MRYRYQITRNGRKVGQFEADFDGTADWHLFDVQFDDPGEPRTTERMDEALYAAGYEVMPEE